jgi:hypothetical protein
VQIETPTFNLHGFKNSVIFVSVNQRFTPFFPRFKKVNPIRKLIIGPFLELVNREVVPFKLIKLLSRQLVWMC